MPLEPDKGRGPGFAIGFVLSIIVGLALVLLVWQNQEPVPLRFVGLEAQVPLFVIVLVTAIVAILLDEAIGLVWRRRRRRRLSEKEELARLRSTVVNQPVDEGFDE